MFLSLSTVFKFHCFQDQSMKKFACVLCSEWPQKESITKRLSKQSIKHWESLTKKEVASCNVPGSALATWKKQVKISKFITEMTKSQRGIYERVCS